MNSPASTRRPRALREGGFTLIEMVTAAAIFGMLVGFTFPIAEMWLRDTMIDETREEMLELRDGVLDYYEDVEAMPAALVDLVDPDPVPDGWMGPYLPSDFDDDAADSDDYRFDVWRSAYVLTPTATTLQITSLGENRVDDGGAVDDIVLTVELGPVMGLLTREEIAVINTAITTYNADFVFSNPLSTDYVTLLGQLQGAGYLPADADSTIELTTDAWGQNYVTNGVTPVIEIRSLGAP